MDRDRQLSSPFRFFESRSDEGVWCAVRDDNPIPSFINGEAWTYSGTVGDLEAAPADFDLRAAQAGAALTGYHLFLALRS